jgi:hypothetical protein
MTHKTEHIGDVLITPHAFRILVRSELTAALESHIATDDRGACPEPSDEDAPQPEFCLLSSYRDSKGTSFWILSMAHNVPPILLLAEEQW